MRPTPLARWVAVGVLAGLLAPSIVARPQIEMVTTGADATAAAYVMVGGVTATPCDPWAKENATPVPRSHPVAAPCAVVAFEATWTAHHATETAGIIDGSYYGLHVSNSAPNWTPTVYTYGTVPAAELTAYPLTLTALPWPTPHGWHLEGDRWVVNP